MGDLRLYVLFNSILVISGQLAGDNERLHCIKIRSFYGKIPCIWLPVLLPLFLRAFTCRTFFRTQDMVGLC